MAIDVLNARELAARSHAKRRQNRLERELAEQADAQALQTPAELLRTRASEIDLLLSSLKADLRKAKDSQDKLRLAQAIDRLEQSWARYAGVPTPPKGRPGRRTPTVQAEPLD